MVIPSIDLMGGRMCSWFCPTHDETMSRMGHPILWGWGDCGTVQRARDRFKSFIANGIERW
jgi:hypothetical protein